MDKERVANKLTADVYDGEIVFVPLEEPSDVEVKRKVLFATSKENKPMTDQELRDVIKGKLLYAMREIITDDLVDGIIVLIPPQQPGKLDSSWGMNLRNFSPLEVSDDE